MKRLLLLILLAALVVSAVPVAAQEAPEGVFPGTWDYFLPPDHHFNGFATGGPSENLGVVYRQVVEMPFGFFRWADNTWEGLLAESWGFTEDNSAYEVTLKEATWSDGSPVTSADVLATYAIGRILNWAQFNYISGVEAVDERTVRFTFSGEPSLVAERQIMKEYIRAAATYQELADEATALVESGATREDEAWAALATKIAEFRPEGLLATGPYTYTLDDVGDSFMSVRWHPNSIYSDSVNFGELRIWKGETEASTPLVLNGDVAWATNVYPPATQQAFTDAGIRLITTPRGYGPALLFNHDVYPFNVKEVRQAMAYAIDRAENGFLTNGFGATPTKYMAGILDDQVPALIDAETVESLNQYPYDLDAAAAKMEEAGFTRDAEGKWVDAEGNRISAEYKVPAEFTDFYGAGSNATEQLNEFGFDITLVAVPWQQAAEDIREGAFDLSVWSWASGSPFATTQFYGPIQRFNYPGLTATGQQGMNFQMEFEYNGEMINLDTMINEVSGGLDTEAQKVRAGAVARVINDLMPFIPLNVIVSTEPWNESILAGAPEEGDPLLQNPSTDHFVIKLLLDGTLAPASGGM
jgi:peptide/nickel transport system substrate-binding protein